MTTKPVCSYCEEELCDIKYHKTYCDKCHHIEPKRGLTPDNRIDDE